MIRRSWESCLFSITIMDQDLMMLKSIPALTSTALVSSTAHYSLRHIGWRHCWQTPCFPSHLHDYGLQIYSFFECANCSLQNTPQPNTPPEAGSENAPEAAHGWLGKHSLKSAKERCQFTLRGREHLI